MRTYDKSLTEVWEWKEKVYSETKGLSAKDYVRKTIEDAAAVLSENHIELTSIPSSRKHEKVA